MLIHCSLLTEFSSVSLPAQLDDEDSILPHKLQAALEHVLDKRRELACDKGDLPNGDSTLTIDSVKMQMYKCFYSKYQIH